MTSNIYNIRQTFGILQENGQLYSDIISASLETREISYQYIPPCIIIYKGIEYTIHMDSHTKRFLRKNRSALCIISYQIRTTGSFAMIRLYKEKK